jgi:hypothetical protein
VVEISQFSVFTVLFGGATMAVLYPTIQEGKQRDERSFWDFVNYQKRRAANGMKLVPIDEVPAPYREKYIKYIEKQQLEEKNKTIESNSRSTSK